MAALAVSSGNLGGTNELKCLMQFWLDAQANSDTWIWKKPNQSQAEILPEFEHVPGFEVSSQLTSLPVKQALDACKSVKTAKKIQYLKLHLELLSKYHNRGLTMISVAACVYLDLGLSIAQAQYHFLQSKLIGAAHHALEQSLLGWKNFPFAKTVHLINDPGF